MSTKICDKTKRCHSPKWAVEGASPYISEITVISKHGRPLVAPTVFQANSLCRKIAVALCGFYVVLWDRKSGAEFFYSDTALILLLVCFSSIAFLHRFCRLAPIEALPQAPQGTLSLDPASPLTPGLSLRFISRYTRC